MYNNREYNATYLSAGSTSQIFTGKGILHSIAVNSSTATVIGVYDSISSTSTGTTALIKASIAEGVYNYDITIANGLYLTYGAGNYTVIWTK